jgi:cyclase
VLAKRIVPSILVRGKTAYKGPGFGAACTRSVGSALAIARTHARRGVDELLILDIGATPEGRGPDLDLVRALSDECFIPITVGGGVKTLGDIDALLRAGADKVAIGAAYRERPDFIDEAADRFGSQAIVAIVEHASTLSDGRGELCIPGEAGEIVLQCRDLDGAMSGYDLALLSFLSDKVDVPMIISGGCSGAADMAAAIRHGADAVAAGALFQFTDATPRDCALYLKSHNIEVRL